MKKISLLSRQSHADRRRDNATPTASQQAARLTHSIMNQLTIIYMSCSRLRHRLGAESAAKEDSDIRIIESAVETIAAHAEALRFRLEKTTRPQAKARARNSQKQLASKTKLSLIPPRGIDKM
jgi:hypothetical protein